MSPPSTAVLLVNSILVLCPLLSTTAFLPRHKPSGQVLSKSTSSTSLLISGQPCQLRQNQQTSSLYSSYQFIVAMNDDDDGNNEDEEDDDGDDDEEEKEDPYRRIAESEFKDPEEKSSALATLGSDLDNTIMDWGGALGKLRERVGDVESGKSSDPSHALFRMMSSETPNQVIGKFIQSANPQVVQAMSGAVGSLLGGLSNPNMGVETVVKATGEKVGSLCFQLQMTG